MCFCFCWYGVFLLAPDEMTFCLVYVSNGSDTFVDTGVLINNYTHVFNLLIRMPTRFTLQFNTFVDTGVLLNNYAHVFDLLIRLRQAVNHPYMVVHSATTPSAGQGVFCDD